MVDFNTISSVCSENIYDSNSGETWSFSPDTDSGCLVSFSHKNECDMSMDWSGHLGTQIVPQFAVSLIRVSVSLDPEVLDEALRQAQILVAELKARKKFAPAPKGG
jgi:hypothetical protein